MRRYLNKYLFNTWQKSQKKKQFTLTFWKSKIACYYVAELKKEFWKLINEELRVKSAKCGKIH